MRNFRNIILTMLSAFLLYACGGKSTASFEGMEFDSIVIDTVAKLGKAENAPSCQLRLSIQYAKGKNAQKFNDTLLRSGILVPDYFSLSDEKMSVKAIVDSFACRFVADYLRDYGTLYQADMAHADSYRYDLKVTTSTHNGGDDILNYVANIYTFGGGAHGINQTLVRNFDMKTCHMLTLEDVFISDVAIKDMIVEKLIKQFDVDSFDQLKEMFIFADGQVYVPDNFILEDDKVTFIYCEDEIAPHEIGEIRVEFDKSDLKSYMR